MIIGFEDYKFQFIFKLKSIRLVYFSHYPIKCTWYFMHQIHSVQFSETIAPLMIFLQEFKHFIIKI